MRKKLRALKNKQRPTFSATFDKYSIGINTTEERALLKNVKYKSQVVADHVWVGQVNLLRKHNIKPGDIIRFQASIGEYLRACFRSKTARPSRKIELEYGLKDLSNIKIIGSNK